MFNSSMPEITIVSTKFDMVSLFQLLKLFALHNVDHGFPHFTQLSGELSSLDLKQGFRNFTHFHTT